LDVLGIRKQRRDIGSGSAIFSTANFRAVEYQAGVQFFTWAGRAALRSSPYAARDNLRELFNACVRPEVAVDDRELYDELERKFQNIPWNEALRAASERDLEDLWLPIVNELFASLPIPRQDGTVQNMRLLIRKDRSDILLPRDVAIYFSKPKPDWIAYIADLENAVLGSTLAVPLTTIGNKGGPHGTTIDAAMPQDACTTYCIAHSYALWGMPLDDICVVSASTEHGVVAQFFVTFFSDAEETDAFTPAAISAAQTPRTPTTPHPPTSTSPDLDPSTLAKRLLAAQPLRVRTRHLIMMPLSKKLDPTDPDDRSEMAKMYLVMRRTAIVRVQWFLEASRNKSLWQMKAAAEPVEEPEDGDEGDSRARIEREEILTEDEIVQVIKQVYWPEETLSPGVVRI
ncbi:hypothetical protein HK104_000987, partial [Borealophlyctis nickersoniae]